MSDKELVARHGLIVGGNTHMRAPAGNTGQRPAAPANGDIRYNNDTGVLEAYANNAWLSQIVYGNTMVSPGVNTQVVFNVSGALGTNANLTFDSATGILAVPNVSTNSLSAGIVTINTTAVAVGADAGINSSVVSVGNTTVNSQFSKTGWAIGNSTTYVSVNAGSFSLVNSSAILNVNSSGFYMNAGISVNTSGFYVNAGPTINATGFYVNAGPTINSSGFYINTASADLWQPWVNTVSANTTATNKAQLSIDTSGGIANVALPASPTTGMAVRTRRVGNTYSAFVLRNGSTITALSEDFEIDINYAMIEFRFDGTTWNWY